MDDPTTLDGPSYPCPDCGNPLVRQPPPHDDFFACDACGAVCTLEYLADVARIAARKGTHG